MAETGGRINPNGAYNEEMGSVMDQLKHMPRELRSKYYRNRRKYYADYAAFQAWANDGFLPSEWYEGTDFEVGEG